jgi:hypothetical protein
MSPTATMTGPRRRVGVAGSRRWTEERVREELRGFLAGREEWPSYREFWNAGRKGLRDAVTRFGGARRWAREFGMTYVERRPGYAPIWTEERIRADLTRFLTGREFWPTRIEFEAAGLKALRDAVGRSGGPPRWAAEFGLPRLDERRGSRRVWTDERIEEELRRLIGPDGRWPSTAEFRRAGKTTLQAAVYAHGGPDYWGARVGAGPPARRNTNRPVLWDEQRIGRELREVWAEHGGWPRFAEFEAMGKGKLYRAASRNGGVEHWKRKMGVV